MQPAQPITSQTLLGKPQADKEPETASKPDVKEQIKSAGAGQAMTMSLVNGQLKLTPVSAESGAGSGSDKSPGKESSGAFDAILGGAHDKPSCKKVKVVSDVTLKGGKSAGKFNDHGDVKSMDTCQDLCCKQKDCNIAFMLGKTCYSVTCKDNKACEHTTAPPSNFNPRLAYVRPVQEPHKGKAWLVGSRLLCDLCFELFCFMFSLIIIINYHNQFHSRETPTVASY